MPTDQEVFDTVVRHLYAQGYQALQMKDQYSGCVYFAKDGSKCAIGCLIPDELYSKDMEDNPVVRLINSYPKLKIFTGNNANLLRELQSVHDNNQNWDPLGLTTRAFKYIREIAQRYRLSPNVIDSLAEKPI